MDEANPSNSLPAARAATLLRDRLTRKPWLHFRDKPDDATIAALRTAGWRWGSYRKAWFHPSPLAVPPPSIPSEDGGECDYAAERAERLEARATRAAQSSEQHHAAARRIGDAIPFGQPILVGHHSEKRHRRDLDRLHRHVDAACEQANDAERLRHAAQSSRAHQQHLEDAGTIRRRLDRLQADLRKMERHPWGEAHAAQYQLRLSQLRAEIQRNEELLAAAGPQPSTTLDVRPGAGMTGKWDKSWLQAIVERGSGSR